MLHLIAYLKLNLRKLLFNRSYERKYRGNVNGRIDLKTTYVQNEISTAHTFVCLDCVVWILHFLPSSFLYHMERQLILDRCSRKHSGGQLRDHLFDFFSTLFVQRKLISSSSLLPFIRRIKNVECVSTIESLVNIKNEWHRFEESFQSENVSMPKKFRLLSSKESSWRSVIWRSIRDLCTHSVVTA